MQCINESDGVEMKDELKKLRESTGMNRKEFQKKHYQEWLIKGKGDAKIVIDKMNHKDYIGKNILERKLSYVVIRSRKGIRHYSDKAD